MTTYDDWKTTDPAPYETHDVDAAADHDAEVAATEQRATAVFVAIRLAQQLGQIEAKTVTEIVDALEGARDDIAQGEPWDECLQALADSLPFASWDRSCGRWNLDKWLRAVDHAVGKDYKPCLRMAREIELDSNVYGHRRWNDHVGDQIGG